MAIARELELKDREPSRDKGTGADAARTILLASEGRPISVKAVAKAAQLASDNGAKVHVLSVARIWGTAFGLQHPGLFPTQRELQSQRDIVADAIEQIEAAACRRHWGSCAQPQRGKSHRREGAPGNVLGDRHDRRSCTELARSRAPLVA